MDTTLKRFAIRVQVELVESVMSGDDVDVSKLDDKTRDLIRAYRTDLDKQGLTPRAAAKDIVGKSLGISVRSIEEALRSPQS
jgi:hypothetical protein